MTTQSHPVYTIERRTRRASGGTLKGFAIDIVIRFNSEGVPFVQDCNAKNGMNSMPLDPGPDQVAEFVRDEIHRNYAEHFSS